MEFKTASHAAYRLYYHLVLVTKYRKKCLSLEVYQTLEDIIRSLCETWGCTLLELNGEEDHVHILFEGKPSMDISHFVNNIKTISSRLVRKQHGEHLAKWYWKPVLWSGSYAIVTEGGAPLEVIKQYIVNQEKPTK